MDKRYIGALVANAASLGHHWIYNSEFLEKESLERDLLFNIQDKDVYDRGMPSYYVYPNAKVGDFSTQGMFFKWLYEALKENKDLSLDGYIKMLYEKIRPGGSYQGYIETYAKKMIIEELHKELKLPFEPFIRDDMHLVNFIPYMVCKIYGLDKEKAFEIAKAFTNVDDFYLLYGVLDHILEDISKKPIKEVLISSIDKAPKHFQEALRKAIEMDDTTSFIKNYAGIACHIPHSIPLIFHILSHATSYEDMVRWNTKIGGASSDRGLLLGFIMSELSNIPETWIKKTNL